MQITEKRMTDSRKWCWKGSCQKSNFAGNAVLKIERINWAKIFNISKNEEMTKKDEKIEKNILFCFVIFLVTIQQKDELFSIRNYFLSFFSLNYYSNHLIFHLRSFFLNNWSVIRSNKFYQINKLIAGKFIVWWYKIILGK